MILPPRGAPVDTNRRAKLRGVLNPREVVQRIDKLVDRDQVRLTEIFSDEDVHQLCDQLEIKFRERDFTPAITLGLFVSQCLSRGDACSTVLAKFNRERKRRGQAPENLDREIAVGVLAYNLVRSLTNDAAAVLEIHPREVSFSRSRDAWMSFSDEINPSIPS